MFLNLSFFVSLVNIKVTIDTFALYTQNKCNMDIFKKYKGFTLFYTLVFIANLVFFEVLTDYRMVSKPMIMASLIGFYISVERKQSNAFILAMIFAIFGDIFLMFSSEDFFKLGLGSFLIMQILYTFTFLQDRIVNTKTILIKSIPVLFITLLVITYLWNGLGDLKVPVTIYALAISLMVISALIRKTSVNWYGPVVIGVVLFLVSDALIAVSKFGNMSDNILKYLIMATYMIAQYLIVRGVVERNQPKSA